MRQLFFDAISGQDYRIQSLESDLKHCRTQNTQLAIAYTNASLELHFLASAAASVVQSARPMGRSGLQTAVLTDSLKKLQTTCRDAARLLETQYQHHEYRHPENRGRASQ